MPLVSVVIPTFGRADLVTRAIGTVLNQTLRDLEVLVVIDGDDPSTVSALKLINDARLRVISHQTSRGAGQARDTGADSSKGEWIAFLDDDDEWLPEKLEKQLASAPSRPAVIMTLSRIVDSTGEWIQPMVPYDGQRPVDEWLFDRRTWFQRGEGFLQTSSLMMPRSLFDHLHFTDTKQHEEWELVIRAVKQLGYLLVTVPYPLVVYYVPGARPSLSKTYTWTRSIEWVNRMRPLMTARAYSGFCLTVVARIAANTGQWAAFFPLLRTAFHQGKPTVRQLAAFVLLWCFPEMLRRKAREIGFDRKR